MAPSQVEATARQPLFGALPESSQFRAPPDTRRPPESRDSSPPANSLNALTSTAQTTPKAELQSKKHRPDPLRINTDHRGLAANTGPRSAPVTVGNMLGITLEPESAPKSAPPTQTLINLFDEPHQQPHHPPSPSKSNELHSDLMFLDANSFSPTTPHANTPTATGGDVFDLLATPGPQKSQFPNQAHTSHGGDVFDLLGLDTPEPAAKHAPAPPLSPVMAELEFLGGHFPPNPAKANADGLASLIDFNDEPPKVPSLPGVPSAHPHTVPAPSSTQPFHHTTSSDPHASAAKHEPKPNEITKPPVPEKATSAMEQLVSNMMSEIDKKDNEGEE